MDEDAPPSSPPLPKRGAYSIDFDSLDENTNPFATKSKIGFGSSPPINSNTSNVDCDAMEDPFKPRKSLPLSPPGSPKLSSHLNRSHTASDDGLENSSIKADEHSLNDSANSSYQTSEDAAASLDEKPKPQAIPK